MISGTGGYTFTVNALIKLFESLASARTPIRNIFDRCDYVTVSSPNFPIRMCSKVTMSSIWRFAKHERGCSCKRSSYSFSCKTDILGQRPRFVGKKRSCQRNIHLRIASPFDYRQLRGEIHVDWRPTVLFLDFGVHVPILAPVGIRFK